MPNEVNVINGTDNSRSESPANSTTGPSGQLGTGPRPKKFLNGWTKEQDRLMADWTDLAICYRWLHDNANKKLHIKALGISLPVIFLSTISGFSNIGVQAILESETQKKYASFAIAAISLMAGLMTTVGDRLRYAQLEESHRVAAIAWGKFQRLLAVELALNPNDRMDSLDFLKICRAELDRLIEQSPPIPRESINIFEKKFGSIKDLKKPDICGSLEHTHVFESSETRLKMLASEAALLLRRKKQTLSELMTQQMEETIARQVEIRLAEAIEGRRKDLEDEIEHKKQEAENATKEAERVLEERRKRIQEEIELEKKKLYGDHNVPSTAVSVANYRAQFESRLNYKNPSAFVNKSKTQDENNEKKSKQQQQQQQQQQKQQKQKVILIIFHKMRI